MDHAKPTFDRKRRTFWGFDYREYIPKSVICFQEGYTRSIFLNDLIAGVSVGIIALPLAMAFAIASGLTPERGLYTAIIAGFLISLLGGSRVQIGGPTGAFVVIVYSVVQRHGYDGLAIATLMAGLMIALMGLARFGGLLKFIPYPVTVGFTSGIAVVIFSSQIKDFFGLQVGAIPVDFLDKWTLYFTHLHHWNPWAFGIALGSLLIIATLRHYYPRIPGAIIAIILATAFVTFLDLPVETIAKKFGSIPRSLPEPTWPDITFEKIQTLFPDAITIALLGAIESLLSAVVADGMTGTRHRSNCELLAQGIANIGSVIFGGIPATGAIARTTANVKMHAKTPVAGMIHAITLLLLMLLFAPIAALIPLSALAAVLVIVAWNMSELHHFVDILKGGQKGDAAVLSITFLLTILIDLTVAVQVGILLAALLFLKKMSESTTGNVATILMSENTVPLPELHDSEIIFRTDIPKAVTVFEIDGPLFFAVADVLNDAFHVVDADTKFFILRMRKVPLVDTTGIHALKQFHQRCKQRGVTLILSGVHADLQKVFMKTGLEQTVGKHHIFSNINDALDYTKGKLY